MIKLNGTESRLVNPDQGWGSIQHFHDEYNVECQPPGGHVGEVGHLSAVGPRPRHSRFMSVYSCWVQSESFEGPGGVPGGCLQAAAMLVCPAVFKIAMARLRRAAMAWGPLRVRTWERPRRRRCRGRGAAPRSASDRGSRRRAGRGGLVSVQAGDGVDGDGPPPPAVQRPDLAGEADGLGGVREGEPGGDGRGLEGAVLLAAVAPVVLAGGDRDVPPGQVLDLGVQARLVLLHDQDVMGLLLGDQELGVLALGVQRVGGDDAPGQVQRLAAAARTG